MLPATHLTRHCAPVLVLGRCKSCAHRSTATIHLKPRAHVQNALHVAPLKLEALETTAVHNVAMPRARAVRPTEKARAAMLDDDYDPDFDPAYGDEDSPPPPSVRKRSTSTSLRLDEDTLARLRHLARKKGKGYQTLLKEFVVERLYEEEKREGVLK